MAKAQDGRGAIPDEQLLGTIDDARELYQFADPALAILEEIGIPMPQRPKLIETYQSMYPDIEVGVDFDGRMPPGVRALTLNQISALYSLFMNWYSYVASKEKEWKAKKAEAKKIREHMQAASRRLHAFDEYGEKRSDQVARDMAKVDYDFMESEANLELVSAVHELIEAQLSVASKNLSMISREITVRGLEIESQSRHRGVNKRYGRALRQANEEDPGGEFGEEGGDDEDEPRPERGAQRTPSKANGRYAKLNRGKGH